MSMSATRAGKRQRRLFVFSVTMAIIAVLNTAADAQRHLRMEVEAAPPDPNRVIIGAPAAKTYIGRLRNTGKPPVLVQVVPIAGRHQGNGLRGACYLERWDSISHRWIYLAPALVSLESTPVYSFTLRGGDTAEVCGRPSASELGQPGACYRFTLQVQMKGRILHQFYPEHFAWESQKKQICQRDAEVDKRPKCRC